MDIPENFRRNILSTFGEKGKKWLESLPALVASYMQLWKLKPNGNFELSFNYVIPVLTEDNQDAVLKLGPHAKGRAREAFCLKYYEGNGAVRLLNEAPDHSALLIERATPGETLHATDLSDHEKTLCAIDVMGELLQYTSEPKNPVLQSVGVWGLGFEKYLRENGDNLKIPEAEVTKADRIFKQLVRTSPRETVLHGDLHHFNILQNGEGWLAIDPKGCWGDPCYEVGAFIRNPMPELSGAADLQNLLSNRMQLFSDELGFDLERIWAWSYAQSILASIWAIRDGDDSWAKWYSVAQAIESLEEEL